MKRFTLNQKHRSNQSANLRLGFTIVELLIVIVVISILATITVVAYNGIQQNARIVSLQSDLSNADASLALAYTQNGTYPANLASAGLTASPGTTYQYAYKSSDKSYCLTATNGSTTYVISTANPTPAPGVCPVVVLTAPIAPTNLAAAGGTTQISLTWTAPTDDGGSAITGYKLYRGTTANPTTLVQTLGNVNSYADTGLAAGTTYYYRVIATNSIGDSSYSTQATATVLANPGNLAFAYTGSAQSWTAPNGVFTVTVEVWGAQGATGSSAAGGKGGYAKGTLTLSAGDSLSINVGGMGTGIGNLVIGGGGYNGGGNGNGNSGGGGGASDVRKGGTSLTNRIIVAGGGGGAGFYSGLGGDGGGLTGGIGTNTTNGTAAYGGGGGSQSSGGVGSGTYPGTTGSLGIGGNGGNNGSYSYSGGGGGGYYGAGGGAASVTTGGDGYGAAGGGGSSYIGGVTGGSTTTGTRSGNGQVIITW